MANELAVGIDLGLLPPYQQQIMNWFTPIDKPQLLPKDLLNYARKIPKDEVDKHIMDAIKQKTLYSGHNLMSSSVIFTNPMIGTTSTASIPWGTFSTFTSL